VSLDTFIPEPRVVTVGDKAFALTPLRFGKAVALLNAWRPAMPLLYQGQDWHAAHEHHEAFLKGLSIVTGEPPEWFEEQDPVEVFALANAVLEVDADFFGRGLPATVRQAGGRMVTMLRAAGVLSSPGSEPSDTGETTPST
jgi:hypothetical protein